MKREDILKKNKAVFLDRDGTVIEECKYLDKEGMIRILDGVASAIRLLNKGKFKVIIISNQSGVGRGYFTEKEVLNVNKKLLQLLKSEGAIIDGVYFCPHKPSDHCKCRKPKAGLIDEARGKFKIDLKKSYVIGDKLTDIKTGVNAGLRTILVLTGYGKESSYELKPQSSSLKPDYTAKDLLSAVKWILKVPR